jgi:hypothetical protein
VSGAVRLRRAAPGREAPIVEPSEKEPARSEAEARLLMQ